MEPEHIWIYQLNKKGKQENPPLYCSNSVFAMQDLFLEVFKWELACIWSIKIDTCLNIL